MCFDTNGFGSFESLMDISFFSSFGAFSKQVGQRTVSNWKPPSVKYIVYTSIDHYL